MLAAINAKGVSGHFLNANQAAKDLGNILLTNVVMLGAFTKISSLINPDTIITMLLSMVKPKFHEGNKKAFACGQNLIKL
jgi:indolepyruvate ferredoxin oxidoreductase beta subunit